MKAAVLKHRSLLQQLPPLGIRITGPRKIRIETIRASARHPDDATELQRSWRRDDGINRATVYRMIELLKKLRLIDELDRMPLACNERGRTEE